MSLSPPPSDSNGNVVPHDHADISADGGVIRRISEQQLVIKNGQRRISSIAFQASSGSNGGMSVDLQQSIESAGLDSK
jgi:hypothetical protein